MPDFQGSSISSLGVHSHRSSNWPEITRSSYSNDFAVPANRSQAGDQFPLPPAAMREADNRFAFDELVEEIAGEKLNWTIDQDDSGSYFEEC